VAAETADLWRNGLAQWEIGPDRLRALQHAAHFAVYTPGSDASIPISILASLKAPDMPWEGNQQLLLEKISGTVTALLTLVGFDEIDPVQSREHILLSNIFQHAWRQGRDLTLADLILQTQSPPFEKLGVFDIETFFPVKDRAALAMRLSNIPAVPTFQTWIQGVPLDIQSLLYAPDGKPRHSVFYLAHLSDQERMFFVTLFFSAVEAWMRTQPGSDALRALVYFDEIYGYLPPTANPPSKQPMLRMLKQARAFGLGLVLATQNPVDVDYKALSNMGTWFIGRLQPDRDKQRLLDGLQGASPGVDRGTYDRLISSLRKRVFLLHNVHEAEPVVFHTRWAMNYLPGPLTRAQIPALNRIVGAEGPSGGRAGPRGWSPRPWYPVPPRGVRPRNPPRPAHPLRIGG
jgi:Predicted ATPase